MVEWECECDECVLMSTYDLVIRVCVGSNAVALNTNITSNKSKCNNNYRQTLKARCGQDKLISPILSQCPWPPHSMEMNISRKSRKAYLRHTQYTPRKHPHTHIHSHSSNIAEP